MDNIEQLGKRKYKTYTGLFRDGGGFSLPVEIANHLNNYFMTKIDKLESRIIAQSEGGKVSGNLISQLMEGKNCSFEFRDVSVAKI